MSLFGGLAAATLGGAAIAQAGTRKFDLASAPLAGGEIDTATKAALDRAEADYSQVVVRERVVRRRPRRPVVVRERVIVRRRRPRRPVVVRRRVIVR